MRTVVALAALPALVTAAHTGAAAPPLVSCDSAVMFSDPSAYKPTSGERIVLGRVAVPQRELLQVAHVGGRLPYWRKAGLLVRAHTRAVTISVPPVWRERVAVMWGDSGLVPALRIAPCATHGWNVYTGGFYLRRPACVPLTVRVGNREATVRFGVGRRCVRRGR